MRHFWVLGGLLAIGGCTEMMPPPGPPVASAPDTPVFFQPYSAALDQPALAAIAAAAREARDEPGARVVVIGAADAGGDTKADIALSKARARAVAGQLVADGVAPSRVRAHGIGDIGGPAQADRRAVITIE